MNLVEFLKKESLENIKGFAIGCILALKKRKDIEQCIEMLREEVGIEYNAKACKHKDPPPPKPIGKEKPKKEIE
jgi:uncharacterized UBP type Zn finger protein